MSASVLLAREDRQRKFISSSSEPRKDTFRGVYIRSHAFERLKRTAELEDTYLRVLRVIKTREICESKAPCKTDEGMSRV